MTLIEIMVVIAIISTILVAAGTRLGGSGREMKQAVRRLSVLGKDLHNKAKLFNKTYRIVIQMNPEEKDMYWVESSTKDVKVTTTEQEENLQKLTKLQREGLVKDYGFALDAQVTKKPFTLPSSLQFTQVEFSERGRSKKEGKAYIHFFPQGLVQEAAIHLSAGENLNWTVSYHPVTGKADVITRFIPLKDIRGYEKQ